MTSLSSEGVGRIKRELNEHACRTASLSGDIARTLSIDPAGVVEITIAAYYHDIGKEYLPQYIFLKPEALTPQEFEMVKLHTYIGSRVLSLHFPKHETAAEVALHHHERADGTGYWKKKSHEVSLAAKIVSVADVYTALTADRVYRPTWTPEQTREYIRENSGAQFDMEVVDAFVKCMRR